MRILIITHLCTPEPDLKGLPFAKQLLKEGHSVEIFTGLPNYPGGKLYKGYKRKLFYTEIIDGIIIKRFLSYHNHSTSFTKRALAYLSFAIIGAFWALIKTRKADVIYVNMTPAPIAFPALVVKLFRRTPVVIDIQDLWPETLEILNIYKGSVALKIIDMFCKAFYRWSDFVVVPSKGLKEILINKNVSTSKVRVIYNWSSDVRTTLNCSSTNEKAIEDRRFTILFAGNIGIAQGLSTILEAAKLLLNSKIDFAFIGDGVELGALKEKKERDGLTNVIFLPRVPVHEVGQVLSNADALLVHLTPNFLFDKMIPGKTQAYLKMGKPILSGVNGEANQLIEAIGAGVTFNANDVEDLCKKARSLSQLPKHELYKMGLNGKLYYEENLSIEVGTRNFIELFDLVIRR
jgi:colanic acid biosynthesis glycosyl transferase WcaI